LLHENAVSIKYENVFKEMKNRINRIKKVLKRLHPFYWYDGLLDGLEIDLKEFK